LPGSSLRFFSRATAVAIAVAAVHPGPGSASSGDGGIADTDGGPADPADAWLSHAGRCLKGVFDMEADFTEEVISRHGVEVEAREGTLRLRRKRRMRLDYRRPAGRVVVSDGVVLRAWDPDSETAIEEPIRGEILPLAFAFALDPEGAAGFGARWLGGARAPDGSGPAVVELLPEDPHPLVERIAVTMEPGCPSVSRVVAVDRAGTAIRVTLSDPRTNVGLGARLFRFDPPTGAAEVLP